MDYKFTELGSGVEGLYVKDDRFNTTLVTFNFYLPLNEDTAAQNALLPFILSACSEEYPDFSVLNFKLASLYGAKLTSGVNKIGDFQRLSIGISCIKDKFALDGESIVSEATSLLASLIFAPSVNGEAFSAEDTAREKRLMRDRILSEISEKRIYARQQAIRKMFEGDSFAVDRFGSLESLDRVTPEDLFDAWENMLRSAFVRVQVFSDVYPTSVFEGVKKAFAAISRENITDFSNNTAYCEKPVLRFDEKMSVAQGKLVMGFYAGAAGSSAETLPMAIMTDLFGGGPYSKLFTNVREKMSLCYYCSASVNRNKGYMLVESGVEAANAERAEQAILAQLDDMKLGNFMDTDLKYSKAGIKDSLRSSLDSLASMDRWFAGHITKDDIISPEELISLVDNISANDIEAAAKKVSLTTVYRLLPKEEGEN